MRNSKLFDYLKKIKPEQWPALSRFVRSPFYNSREEVITFFEFIQSFHADLENEQLKKENAFQMLFPGQPYDNQKIRHLMSYLNDLTRRFLVVQKLESNKEVQEIFLLESMLDMFPIEKAFNQRFNIAMTFVENKNEKSAAYYELKQRLYDLADKNFLLKRERRNDDNLQLASDFLDQSYVLKKLKYLCSMLSREKILSTNYELHFIDEIINRTDSELLRSVPLIEIYYSILGLLKSDFEIADFTTLKALILKYKTKISSDEMQEIFQYAINFCLSSLRKGKDEFVEEALNLYIEGIEDEILLQNGVLSPWTYTNVAKLALRKEKFDWIKTFLHANKKRLPKSVRKNVLNYNLAEVHFYKKEYDAALRLLQEVEFHDLTFNLSFRVMLAKIYFEKEEIEVLLSLIASFSIYIKRSKKLSAELKQTNLNFCLFLKKITKIKKSEKRIELREEIKNCKLLTDRGWLLKILGEH